MHNFKLSNGNLRKDNFTQNINHTRPEELFKKHRSGCIFTKQTRPTERTKKTVDLL